MNPANESRGEVSITLDGVDYVMRPSYEAISAIEDQTGSGLIALAEQAQRGTMKLETLATIVTEAVRAWGRAAGPDASADQRAARDFGARRVGELILEGGILPAMSRAGVMLLLAATGGVTSSGEVKPAAE